ncbi:MAG: anthranilate phosphoribosyltransferase [Campylobacterales bacterium]
MELEQFRDRFRKLFKGEMEFEEGREFLIEVANRPLNGKILAEAAKIMREFSIKLPVPPDLQRRLIDIVGTGGDRKGSFNISTTTALLLSSIGSFVAKHGNRSVTSKSGSGDLLEQLGFNLNLPPEAQVELLKRVRFTFIFAVNYHPGMRHIMPIRRSIPHPTIFNLLGPLTNPAGATRYLLGVYAPELLDPVAEALQKLGVERGLVVSSSDGLDEVSIGGVTYCRLVEGGEIRELEIDPVQFGLKGSWENLKGGTPEENSQITRRLLSGEEGGDKLKALLLSGGVALWVDRQVGSIEEGIDRCRQEIGKGRGEAHLKRIVEESWRVVGKEPPVQ